MVAKDEAKEPKKAKKKAKKKAGKADGREDVALCGCGAVCDQCERCSRRSKSPIRGAPSLPVQAPKTPQASPGQSDPEEEEDSQQKQQPQHRNIPSPLRSPSRSTLGADLVSTPRQSPAAQGASLSHIVFSSISGWFVQTPDLSCKALLLSQDYCADGNHEGEQA